LFNTSLSDPKEFELILKKSGKTITVKEDATIIDALLLNNIKVPYSCLQGICGTCVTTVIEGKVDHRDAVLSEEEKTEHYKMCLCVSRAKEDSLVIDS
jgi:ferredoxin